MLPVAFFAQSTCHWLSNGQAYRSNSQNVLVAQGRVSLDSNYMDDGQIMVKLQFFEAAKPFLLLDKLQQLQVSCPVRILHGVQVGAQDCCCCCGQLGCLCLRCSRMHTCACFGSLCAAALKQMLLGFHSHQLCWQPWAWSNHVSYNCMDSQWHQQSK